MVSVSTQLAVASVCWLALAAFVVQADVVSVPANLAAIQAAIDDAPENAGRVISIGQGNVNMGTSFLRLNKWGVSLVGAGPGKTVFQTSQTTQNAAGSCYANGEGTPLLTVCVSVNPAPAPPPGTQPTLIEGITFKNSDPSPFTSPYNGAEKGIGVLMSGPAPDNPSIIRNCEFINLWKNGPTGIGIELVDASGTRPNNWRIENCRFDGSKTGVYVNGNSDITIANNTFTKFRAGILNDANDKSYGITIAGNDFVGGWTTLNRPSLADVVVAISLSSNANADGDTRNWVIRNNDISDVQQGIDITYSTPGPSSLQGVDISYNSIVASLCSLFRPCFNVINRSPQDVTVTANWWGDAAGPDPSRFQTTSTGQILFDPWIESFKRDPACTTGFCPIDVVLSDAVNPIITSVTASPSLVVAGSTVNVTVVLDAPVDGTLTFTSTPEGITCDDVVLNQQNPIEVTCRVDQAAVADNYTITATVTTTGGTDAKSTYVEVCRDEPWPFTADVQVCQQCSFNCLTGVFTCSNCSCSCPDDGGHEGPYGGGHYEQPYGDKPGYGYGPGSERPYHGEGDRPGYGYGPGDHRPYHGEGDKPGYGYRPGSERPYHGDGDKYGYGYGPSDRLYHGDGDRPDYGYGPGRNGPDNHHDGRPDAKGPYGDRPYHHDVKPYGEQPYGDEPRDVWRWQRYGPGKYDERRAPYEYREGPNDPAQAHWRHISDFVRDHQQVWVNPPSCGQYGGKLCVCNPEPLTNAANCQAVSYDACENKLTCTPWP